MFTTLENRSSDRKIKKKRLMRYHKTINTTNLINVSIRDICVKKGFNYFFSVKRPRSTNFLKI